MMLNYCQLNVYVLVSCSICCETPIPKAPLRGIGKLMRPKLQKHSALKLAGRIIPRSGGYNTPKLTLGFIPVIVEKANIKDMSEATEAQKELQDLIALIKKLRAPDGCPWDKKQKPREIGKYVLDEAYEVADALETKDPQALKEELGDLLFQILFLAEMEDELSQFSLADVMAGIKEKMIRRHPHVFGDVTVNSVQEVKENWQEIKKKERGHKSNEDSLFAAVPLCLPALKRAQKITSIAAAYGFDWPKTEDIREKLKEELQEFDDAVKSGIDNKIEEELGDIFFTIVNLSRFLSVDAETALSKTTGKFLSRFSYITKILSARGISIKEANLGQMDALWNEAKIKDLR